MELNKILIGSMRFPNREIALGILRKAIDYGYNYIDTAPLYRYQDEAENSESWVGTALQYSDYRSRVILGAKSGTGKGGFDLADFVKERGFGVRTAYQFEQVFEQTLQRLKVPNVDVYHLWICHTEEHLREAMKPGGWHEGFLHQKEQGKVNHLGITTHADPDTIIKFLETGLFETVTLPLNIINTTRMRAVKYATEHNIKVIAMNPLGGGFLAADERLKSLAFQYLLGLANVHVLVGFTAVEEVEYAHQMEELYQKQPLTAEEIQREVAKIIATDEPRCTGCGYCQPCPQLLEVGGVLALYNLYKYLHLSAAKDKFQSLVKWHVRYQIERCTECGLCETRCPNNLPIRSLLRDTQKVMTE